MEGAIKNSKWEGDFKREIHETHEKGMGKNWPRKGAKFAKRKRIFSPLIVEIMDGEGIMKLQI
jgi:hypothetical protein